MKKVFLDTNIVLDMLDEKRKNYILALNLMEKLINEDYEIFISEDMLSTIYYISANKENILNFYKEIINDKYWRIIPFEKDVIKAAIDFALKNKKDLEDTLQCFVAKKYRCILITEDKKFVDCGIKIFNYEGFLKNG